MGMFGALPSSLAGLSGTGYTPGYGPGAPAQPVGDPDKLRLAALMGAGSGEDPGNIDPAQAARPSGAPAAGMFGAPSSSPAYSNTMPAALLGSGLGGPMAVNSLGNPTSRAMPMGGGMLGAQGPQKKHPGFNEPGGWAEKLAAIGDVLGRAGGMGSNGAMQALMQNREARRAAIAAQAAKQEDYAHADGLERMRLDGQVDLERMKQDAPQYFNSGNDRVAFNPSTGAANVLYHGASDAENYATTLGYKAGTPQYNRAVQDYVLKSAGPTAFEGRTDLEGVRQGDRVALRGMPTYSNLHPRPSGGGGGHGGGGGAPRTTGNVMAPILAKIASGAPLNSGEQQLYSLYSHRRGAGGSAGAATGGGAGGGSGKVYTDGKGKRITWSGSAWVAAK